MDKEQILFKRKLHDKSIQIKMIIYLLLVLILFASVLYDSYLYTIPFYYVLFFFVGIGVGSLESYTSSIKWNQDKGVLTERQSTLGIVVFISLLLIRIFLVPRFLDFEFHPIHLYDVSVLISIGVFYKKILAYQKAFNDSILSYVMRKEKEGN